MGDSLTETNIKMILLYRENPTEDIANDFIKNNKKLVHLAVKRYRGFLPEEELFSIGMMSIFKAFLKFDPNKGYRFSTLAIKVIHNDLNIVVNRQEKKHRGLKSLEEKFFDNTEGNPIYLKDTLIDHSAHFYIDNLVENEYLNALINKAMPKLKNPKSLRVLENLLSDDPLTQTQLSNELGVSQTQISRWEQKVKSTLKSIHQFYENSDLR